MLKKFKNFIVYGLAFIMIIFDQIIKLIVVNNKGLLPKQIINNILSFTYCENRGVAFSLGDGNVILFIFLNILLIFAVIFFYEKNKTKFNSLGKIFFSMTVAGGVSNLLDRIIRGFVVDFIDINQLFSFAIFNVADIFITVGVLGLAICYIFKIDKK